MAFLDKILGDSKYRHKFIFSKKERDNMLVTGNQIKEKIGNVAHAIDAVGNQNRRIRDMFAHGESALSKNTGKTTVQLTTLFGAAETFGSNIMSKGMSKFPALGYLTGFIAGNAVTHTSRWIFRKTMHLHQTKPSKNKKLREFNAEHKDIVKFVKKNNRKMTALGIAHNVIHGTIGVAKVVTAQIVAGLMPDMQEAAISFAASGVRDLQSIKPLSSFRMNASDIVSKEKHPEFQYKAHIDPVRETAFQPEDFNEKGEVEWGLLRKRNADVKVTRSETVGIELRHTARCIDGFSINIASKILNAISPLAAAAYTGLAGVTTGFMFMHGTVGADIFGATSGFIVGHGTSTVARPFLTNNPNEMHKAACADPPKNEEDENNNKQTDANTNSQAAALNEIRDNEKIFERTAKLNRDANWKIAIPKVVIGSLMCMHPLTRPTGAGILAHTITVDLGFRYHKGNKRVKSMRVNTQDIVGMPLDEFKNQIQQINTEKESAEKQQQSPKGLPENTTVPTTVAKPKTP